MTTSRPRETVLTQAMFSKRGTRDCHICQNDIDVGEKIVAKRAHSFKWYHIKCAKEKNII